ncbi:hypothetical protein BU25DRAFT_417763 [Macroventuria anomochaeta]|uniref:Uncharacterized protein n=1 Tax=Macroventuria anomochaeta TaxID=301207 RepID=A0ACB6SCR3_9PLEO|nr:uncharacterized protein BU25DRAFT_417763 [Macroventuria anomochaeta]KAF2631996.1 hypothetical protein BU25DRAFT_417763 [Macroventuria anomochaeta]
MDGELTKHTGADTIRILVATDSHVGYNERDAYRQDDSWKTFDEVMSLAKEHDVDMVLHAGDLFHENKPSRKSMYHVMRSIRQNCLGEKPCELEMLSDASENFGGIFDHVNYEDEDINVAIPVFAIHGNHDDPSGEGSFSPLDLLQASGLVNYFGRTPEVDKIAVKPVLLQKGRTKLALYGLSNVRDERLFHTWRDGNVKFFQPGIQKDEWFNIMSVHQNHHAHTPTSYLPENFLPDFMDLVVWGHEHECLIDPRYNPEMGFHVMQPGSSVATSLMPGEAVPKHVAILSITGKEFTSESIRLKSVRPFIMKEIVLAEEKEIKEKELWRISDNRAKITQHLNQIVEDLIEEAKREWLELQDDRDENEEVEVPRPLVRLRVEYTAPQPGEFNVENPQRFSNRFMDRVANVNDIVQFHRKKKAPTRTLKNSAEMPDEKVMAEITLSTVGVDKLVKEFLTAQSLTILPQNSFGDAVSQFVNKDDKHAMEQFVNESLKNQLKHLMDANEVDESEIANEMEQYRSRLEDLFASGQLKKTRKSKTKPKPVTWDSEEDGPWNDQPGALIRSDNEAEKDDDDLGSIPTRKPAARGRAKATGATRQTAATKKAAPAAKGTRGKKKVVEEEEEEDEDGDAIMISDDDEESAEDLFVKPAKKAPAKKAAPAAKAPARVKSPVKKTPVPARTRAPAVSKQTALNFSQPSTQRSQPTQGTASRRKKAAEPSDDEISDDDDAFEPAPTTRAARRRRVILARRCAKNSICMFAMSSVSFVLFHHVSCPSAGSAPSWLASVASSRAVASTRLELDLLTGNGSSVMAPAYKVEELLALRDSVSESAVSLDKFADEDVIKEHVLRPTASAQLIGRRSDRSLRSFVPRAAASEAPREVTPEVVPATAPTATYKRPSPSPSVKRGKAERLLKEHGSPPGLRVTAGGRIVPGDLPPLGARPSFNIYNPQALRAAPGNIMAAQSQVSSNNRARIEVVGGQPIVVVGDRMFALPAVNSGPTMPPTTPVADEALAKQVNETAPLSAQGALPGLSFGPSRASSQTPFTGLDLPTLKAQQAVKKQELRTVEQTEVLQSNHQTETWRASMIEKKRGLIVELDALRKHISALESDPATANQQNASTNAVGAMAAPAPLSSFMPPYQQPLAQSMYGYPATNPYAPMMMYPPPFGTFPGFPSVDPAPFVPPPVNPLPHSPGSINRRSRAIEIKPPHEESKKQASSALDPKSPTYEPKSGSVKDTVPPTPSPNKRSPWRQQEASQSGAQPSRTLSHKPSLSSVDTTDFFPTNTHEHSSTRVAPTTSAPQPTRDENRIVPATPEKSWPASPWNEDNTSRSRNDEPAPKIGSWPEAFGKPQSLSPLKQEASNQFSVPAQNRALQTSSSLHTASSNTMLTQDHAQQRTATEEIWPFNVPKAVAHIPSTYQEGFQAGYDHVGMPDSPEVLQGYIQGLLTFLADSLNNRRSSASARDSRPQTADSRTPSLHGLVANSTPHDSAISMTFSRNEAPVGSQENVRTSQGNGTMSSRRDSAYSPQGTIRNAPASFAPGIEFTQEPHQLNDLSAKYPNPTGLFPERMSNGYRHVSSYPSPENEMNKILEKGSAPRSNLQAANSGFGRQFSGNQFANRTNANPQTMQRFYPVHKEIGPSGHGGNSISAARPFANNRVSGLDGAMDDLADLVMETSVDDRRSPVGRPAQSTAAPTSVDAEETGASCFKPSGGKGKQRMTSSPTKLTGSAQDTAASSPANAPSSPKKSGEHSPAKAKLEQVTNRFRRSKKEDPRGMSSEEKVKRSEKWRRRFDHIKQTEKAEIEEYREEESRRNGGRR